MGSSARVVTFQSKHSTFTIKRPVPGVVLVEITGNDVGEHGAGPRHELDTDLANGPFDLFIDARNTRGASIEVSSEWAQWLAGHRDRLSAIHMLTGSRFIHLTAKFVRDFADLGDLMRIYTEAAAFDEALAARLG